MMDLSSCAALGGILADTGRMALTQFLLFAQETGAASETTEPGFDWTKVAWLVGIFAVLILPFVVGNWLAKQFRTPAEGTRLGFILLAVTASACVLSLGELKYGVDLRGGTILQYELDPAATQARADANEPKISAEALVPSLVKRINPSGTQEIVVRPYGEEQIEIIIPEVDQFEVARIKGIIEQAGILRFAIVANGRDDGELIRLATEKAELSGPERLSKVVLDSNGRAAGFWATVDREEKATKAGVRPLRVAVSGATLRDKATGRLVTLPPEVAADNERAAIYLQQNNIEELQILMANRPGRNITGEDLTSSSRGVDVDGSPAVNFRVGGAASKRFYRLTLENKPDGEFKRRLGIVLDDALLSAPSINSPISGAGIISGNFTREEVDRLVDILQAGQLPAALNKQPIAENQIGSTLGHDTITKGVWAIGGSMLLVLIFIFAYYRFAGIIACFALVLNLVMTLAVMILISQPVTLPGLAGLVLTVGMSVDANVLIFERIREELKKGAADRMAIRNGFSRATTTIVDANLTTLITAIVLYAIGTDQIRGFAVTLILGILFSMFTAIYMSRAFFDIAERRGFVSLKMSDLINRLRGQGEVFDFIRLGRVTLVVSLLLVLAGVVAIYQRGASIFDIDFAGGSSVTFQLEEPLASEQVRDYVEQVLDIDPENPTQFTLNSVAIDSLGADSRQMVYKVDTNLEDVNELKKRIRDGFSEIEEINLVTYQVEVADGTLNRPAADTTSVIMAAPATRLVAARPQEEAPAEGDPAPAQDSVAEVTPADDASTDEADADADAPAEAEADAPADAADAAAEGQATMPAENADDGEAASPAAPVGVLAPEQPAAPSPFLAHVQLGVEGDQDANTAQVQADVLTRRIIEAAEAVGVTLDEAAIALEPLGEGAEQWTPDSALTFSDWNIRLSTDREEGMLVTAQLKKSLGNDPIWISSSSIGGRVADDMVRRASLALFASLLCIIGYIWFRFQRVMYGLAAVVALVHDVLITLGAIAVSWWVADALGFLLIDRFKISLTVVAALLTIIGYSLNDTIVVFDRIRETKGKSPRLTPDMVNFSISQTLSRTLLTSLTTLFVVAVLYAFGGEGIHAFAFALVIGVMVGTYSSIFVASPVLLWMIQRNQPAARHS